MSQRLRRTQLWLILAVFVTAGCRGEGDRDRGEDVAVAGRTEANVAAVELGTSVNSAHQVQQPTEEFSPKDTIWASVKTENTPAGTTLVARWLYTENGEEQVVAEDTHTTATEGTGYTSFFITNPEPWPAGSYELRVGIGADTKETKKFSVEG